MKTTNIFSKSIQRLAMTYCHYICMRMHFRAVVLARAVKDTQLLIAGPCSDRNQ